MDEQKEMLNKLFPHMKDIEGLAGLLDKWDTLSENMGSFPPKTTILLPDLFLVGESGSMISKLVKGLAAYLKAKGNLMEFYGDVPYFEFMLNYCPEDREFTEFQRFMEEVSESAGFRNVFKGIVHIRADAWLGHQEERYFLDFMDYLTENTADWLIILSVGKKQSEKVASFEAIVSMFLRIEKLTLHMESTASCLEELTNMIRKDGFELDESAITLLEGSIDVLRKNRFFDASYTMRLLCNDIVYEVYSHELRNTRVLTAEDLAAFSEKSAYIKRTLKKIRDGRAIGFVAR